MDAAALIVVIYLSQKNMNSILDDGIKKVVGLEVLIVHVVRM